MYGKQKIAEGLFVTMIIIITQTKEMISSAKCNINTRNQNYWLSS